MTVLTFLVTNIFFDIPAWRMDKKNFSLNKLGKRYKNYSQILMLGTTGGIAIWQTVSWKALTDTAYNFMPMIYFLIAFLVPIVFVLGAMGISISERVIKTRILMTCYNTKDS